MKIFRAIAAVAFVAAISASVFAQTRPAGTPATSSAPTTASVPDSKIALVDTDAFLDEKQGITKLVTAAKAVEAEFQPRRTELQTLNSQIEKAKADLAKVINVQSQQISQQQQEKIDQMTKDMQRKGEDAQAAYQKRLQEKLGPVYEDVGKALDAYAKAHGITMVLDVTKLPGIVSADGSLDITKAFIVEFNSKNPATTALTKP